jgi:hypothetical protein
MENPNIKKKWSVEWYFHATFPQRCNENPLNVWKKKMEQLENEVCIWV